MTEKQARKLKVGDTLRWKADWTTGIVKDVLYYGVDVEWSDGIVTHLMFKDPGTPWSDVERMD